LDGEESQVERRCRKSYGGKEEYTTITTLAAAHLQGKADIT
jgi:hypothetical protein